MVLKRLIFIVIAAILLIDINGLYAGNHEIIHPSTGESIGWDHSTAIPYWMDMGPLGTLTNEQAKALVEAMMATWAGVETARVGFSYQGSLPEDVASGNIADYLAMTSCGSSERTDIPKDVVPVVFDSDGKIFENLTGIGSSEEVGGLSTLRCFEGSLSDPRSIHQGMIIINGQFIDGKGSADGSPDDLSTNGVAGVMLHELGHLIGLDHSVLNEEIFDLISSGALSADNSRYLPVMLPTVLRKSNSSTTLRPDDVAAISMLYPAPDYLSQVGEIRGTIKDSNGAGVRKVNVIARRADDPLCEAVAALSGRKCVPLVDVGGSPNFNSTICNSTDLYGDYTIEGLTPGNYTVEVEDLEAGWTRNGMYPSWLNSDLPGDAEFYNQNDKVEEPPYTFSIVAINANMIMSNINIVLSGFEAASTQLDNIPLSKFINGPGTRCVTDTVDYAAVLSSGEFAASPGLSATGASDPDGGAGGGCALAHSTGLNRSWINIFILLGLLVILKYRNFKVDGRSSLRAAILRAIAVPAFAKATAGRETPLLPLIYKSCRRSRPNLKGVHMRKRSPAILLMAIAMLLCASVVYASSVVPVDLEKMTGKAGRIFYGKCINTEVIKDERGLVSTLVTYEVIRGAKGTEPDVVTFKVFGVAGDEEGGAQPSTVVGGTYFYPGREDVLFLYKESEWGFTSPIGLWQGAFPVVETQDGPRLAVKSGAYQRTMGAGLKAAGSGETKKISTPDDLLDRVDELLGRSSQNN